MGEEKQQLNVEIDAAIYLRFKHAILDRGMTMKAAVELLAELFADGMIDEMLGDDLAPQKKRKRRPRRRD